eukprot:3688113-Prorocentrum_lima.AAC.1
MGRKSAVVRGLSWGGVWSQSASKSRERVWCRLRAACTAPGGAPRRTPGPPPPSGTRRCRAL